MAEGNQNKRPYRFVTWVDFGSADHYVIPKGTEMFIERVYRFGAIDADYVVALGFLHRDGEKLEFECQLYSVDERPPWKLK
ncbi:MAG: hypothetical protein L3J39_09100 [Verrucomicrobiales bacterium]|nr:hypothetical protein [Verrucomicrobiales bacterium]